MLRRRFSLTWAARSACALLAGLLVHGCSIPPNLESGSPAEEIRSFYVDEVGVESCSVAIVRAGQVFFAGDEHALYRIGSLTKLFVASAAGRLAERGEIDLDAPVTRYSAYSLAPEYADVTMRDLMEHRSGLPRDFLDPWSLLDWHAAFMSGLTGSHIYAGFSGREDFERACNDRRTLGFLRDRRPAYSNVGFALFASALEDATGRSVEELLRCEVTGPMGLNDTTFVPDASQRARLAPPCAGDLPWLVRRRGRVPDNDLGPAMRGCGSLLSSAADCAAFFSRRDSEIAGKLRGVRLDSGRWADYRYGMVYGGASFLCRDRATGDILLILRNATSWPASEDLVLADLLFCRSAGGAKTPGAPSP